MKWIGLLYLILFLNRNYLLSYYRVHKLFIGKHLTQLIWIMQRYFNTILICVKTMTNLIRTERINQIIKHHVELNISIIDFFASVGLDGRFVRNGNCLIYVIRCWHVIDFPWLKVFFWGLNRLFPPIKSFCRRSINIGNLEFRLNLNWTFYFGSSRNCKSLIKSCRCQSEHQTNFEMSVKNFKSWKNSK